jgi:hypothetical protein
MLDLRLTYHAARLLWPDAPSAGLAKLANVPKNTAKCWYRGTRRAPLSVLRLLLAELQKRAAACYAVHRDLEQSEIPRREGEGPIRRGFFRLDPATGENKQNRFGRPQRVKVALD